MKLSKRSLSLKTLFISSSVLLLSAGIISCNTNNKSSKKAYTDPEKLERLKDLFESMSTNYNFTLRSSNEGETTRTLSVYDRYCYYYTYQTRVRRGEHGMFYVEGQSTQDYHIDNNQVVIDFHEGPGKVELVENFAHDDYGNEFAHIPMSELLNVDWTHFYKVDENNYYTQDRKINRVFNYYTNEYLANWNDEYGGEEYYVDFSKSKTSFTFEADGSVSITFLPKYKSNVGFTSDGSFLTISKIGTTSNSIISDYLANPTPISKKEGYGFNTQDYQATFGDVSIPFSSKFSGYISPIEDYKNAAITVYDMCYEDGLLNDIRNNLPDNWEYDENESVVLSNMMGHDVYSYHSLSTITQEVEGQTVENTVDVYYSIAEVPASGSQVDLTLRPKGFFVGEIYRKLGEEAITEFDDIEAYLENNTNTDYLPDISRAEPYSCILRDYSENETIRQSFASQNYYLDNYLVLRVEGISSNGAINLARNFRDDLNKLECYSSVSLDSSTYELDASPNLAYFNNKGEPYMQIYGSTIKNSDDEIVGYQLVIIAYELL